MNYTREPIIETVITPREGCKLVVRSSKGSGTEDYFVDAVEVVSFGHSFFFRSQERPKSFLVPVSDYEILELKETRMVLKNVAADRSIKIGGGREQVRDEAQDPTLAESRPAPESRQKRDGKRRRGRRGRDRDRPQDPKQSDETKATTEDGSAPESAPAGEKAPSVISKLFPPPQTLIKESLDRYKTMEANTDTPPSEEKPKIEESIIEHPTPDSENETEQ